MNFPGDLVRKLDRYALIDIHTNIISSYGYALKTSSFRIVILQHCILHICGPEWKNATKFWKSLSNAFA